MAPRLIYENDSTLKEELEIAAIIAKLWRCEVIKQPRSYVIDFAMVKDGKVVAWAEIKKRYRTFDQYPDCWVSLHKPLFARKLNDYSGLPCFFIVQFSDCLARADILPRREVGYRCRPGRDDPADCEPVALVLMKDFKVIEVKSEAA